MVDATEFEGRVAVVTGGTTEMGQATGHRLAAGGASVVYCSGDGASLEAAARALDEAGLEAHGVRADVASDDDMQRIARGRFPRAARLAISVRRAAGFRRARPVHLLERDFERSAPSM